MFSYFDVTCTGHGLTLEAIVTIVQHMSVYELLVKDGQQANRMLFQTLIVAALAVASEQAPTGCVRDVFTKRFGHFYYEVWNSSGENCSWLFQPPDNRTDLIFLVSIPHIIRYGGNYWNDHIVLPDGSLLPHNTTGREYTHTAEEWCGAYVTAGNVKSKCAANRRVGNVCRNPTRESRSWPPVIKSDSHYYYALISYTFLDCPTILLTKTTPPATTTAPLMTTRQLKSATTGMQTSISQSLETSHTTQSEKPSHDPGGILLVRMKILSVVFGVTTFLGVVGLIVLGCLLRRSQHRLQTGAPPLSFENKTFEDGSPTNLDHYHNLDEHKI